MQQIVLMIHIIVAIALVALVLVQQGKGSDMGAAFGAGASGTVFGSRGSAPFLMKVTVAFAVVFFATSITMARFAHMNTSGATKARSNAPITTSVPSLPTAPLNDSGANK